MENFNQLIGKKIREVRKARGISQEELADKLNITQSSYAKIETGKTVLGVNRLYFIALFFDVEPSTFFPKPSRIDNVESLINSEQDNGLLRTIEQYVNEKNIKIRELETKLNC